MADQGERGKQGDHGQDGREGPRGERGEQGDTGPAPIAKWFDLTDKRLILIFAAVIFIGIVGFQQINDNRKRIDENAYNACVNSARIIKLLNQDVATGEKITVPRCRRP